jgi:hypothetical protein
LWPGLQEKIYAESTAPMTGGLRSANVITQKQISDAKKTLTSELIQKAVTELSQSAEVKKSNDAISDEAVSTIVISEKSTAKDGDEVSSFDLTLKLKIVAVVFDQDQVTNKALIQLRQEIGNDEQIASGGQTTISYDVMEYDQAKQTATLEVTYAAAIVPRLSSLIFNRDKITGKDTQEIKAYFSNFDSVKSVTIKFSPFWVTKAPTLKDHIEIKLQ